MPDYSLGKIYKIVCHKTGLVYIGSTCEPTLARRLAGHVGVFKRFLNGKLLKQITSCKVLENEVYEIILIESYPCESKDELHRQERFYIENNECVNKCIPSRKQEEYRDINKEYREINKIHIKENRRLRYLRDKNKNKIKTIEELI